MENIQTPIVNLDLSKQPPHSPRKRIGGFALACRAIDKCRASLVGTLGAYHYNCPLDNQLFSFKGITSAQFTDAVKTAENYEDVGVWLLTHGKTKTGPEIEDWSDDQESSSLITSPEKKAYFTEDCQRLGLNPAKTTTFDWLEADDRFDFPNPVT